MNLQRTLIIAGLELRQRVRGVAWYVLLGVFFVVLLAVTGLSATVWGGLDAGAGVYSTIVFFVLLLVTLVSPAVSGNSINGDRESATLAGMQVTLASTTDIVIGKFLAAWATGLTFFLISVPFMVFSALVGGLRVDVLLSSLFVLIIETGVFAAFGVGLSGLLARGLFSVVTSYLLVAFFTIGTVIVFALGGLAIQTPQQYSSRWTSGPSQCSEWETTTNNVSRFDLVWPVLAVNPFVILADTTPSQYTEDGNPADMFTGLKLGIRSAQIRPEAEVRYDGCSETPPHYPTPKETIDSTLPSGWIGLGIHALLAAGILWWAIARTHTPARRLPPGTRIA